MMRAMKINEIKSGLENKFLKKMREKGLTEPRPDLLNTKPEKKVADEEIKVAHKEKVDARCIEGKLESFYIDENSPVNNIGFSILEYPDKKQEDDSAP